MSRLNLHWPVTLFFGACVLIISGLVPERSRRPQIASEQEKIEALMHRINQEYNRLDIPRLTLSYESNLSNIGEIPVLNKQFKFFNDVQKELDKINVEKLPQSLQLEYAIIAYETKLSIERIELSRSFVEKNSSIDNKGLYHQANGQNWYLYFMKKWTSAILTPEEITEYGIKEVKRIREEMNQIENASNLSNFQKFIISDQFNLYDNVDIEQLFTDIKRRVNSHLFSIFPDFESLPNLNISQGQNSQLAQTPGYYSNNTFYYNLFDQPFDIKQADWLFIHEGNPGHHFQLSYEAIIQIPAYRESFSYSGYREGWAAYVEDLGKELGLYRTSFNYYSKLQWDLIRSTRLILDVGINYSGWTDKQAMEEWRKYIKGSDKIGKREIARMRRWPAQVLTYKLGSKKIKEILNKRKNELGNSFDLKTFHTTLLSQRSIPVTLIDQLYN
ncbi:MAG: DUF885 family protein [Bacteroidota bacterium]